jgi:hypothetical protein
VRRLLIVEAAAGAAYAVALAALGRGVVLPRVAQVPAGIAVPFLVAAVHAVVLVAVAPVLARPEHVPDGRAWRRLVALGAGGAVGLVAAGPLRVAADALVLGAVLGAFGVCLLAVRDLLRTVRLGEATARVVPALLGTLALTTLLWTGPILETLDDPGVGVGRAIRANPLAGAAGAALGFDWARARPVTYDLFVGQYYPFTYPGPLATLAGWGGLAAVLGTLVVVVARRRSR